MIFKNANENSFLSQINQGRNNSIVLWVGKVVGKQALWYTIGEIINIFKR